MIAHVVLDLPLEGHFDYLVEEPKQAHIVPGVRVRVPFRSTLLTGYVIAVSPSSTIAKLKKIRRVIDLKPIFDEADIQLARRFAAYYGVSLGEALASLLRDVKDRLITPIKGNAGKVILHEIPDGAYATTIKAILEAEVGVERRGIILVADAMTKQRFLPLAKAEGKVLVTTRSGMHLVRAADVVIMIDDDNASFLQEQTPMYHARDVLLMMASVYGCAVHVISMTPSVDIKVMALENKIGYNYQAPVKRLKPVVVDVSNYHQKGFITPAALAAIDAALKANGRITLLLNRRGNYALTRCVACKETVKCPRCDSPLIFEQDSGCYKCRFCTTAISQKVLVCRVCQTNSFKSVGVGVSQLKAHLQKLFPLVAIGVYQRDEKPQPLPHEQIIIATRSIVGLTGQLQFALAVVIDIDRELNRMDMRSSFDAWALVEQLRVMSKQVIVQTHQPGQEMLVAMAQDNRESFYQHEIAIRRELGFSPFAHWVTLTVRSTEERLAQQAIDFIDEALASRLPKGNITRHPAKPDNVFKKRDQYRFTVQLQGQDVEPMVALIKQVQGLKRFNKVLMSISVV